MTRYGWFEYEQKPRRIRNYLTGQQLIVKSVSEHKNLTNFDCQYSDSEITLSVRFLTHQDPKRPPGINVDYREIFSDLPSYGQWRRIDDFLVDALLSWPELDDTMRKYGVHTTGGWRSGVWQSEFCRQFSGGKIGTPEQLTNYIIAEPYVIPLETLPPVNWSLVDVKTPVTEVNLKFELLTDSNVPYLSRNSPVAGFQGLVPFLERNDKAAYILFSSLEPFSNRGEDPMTLLYYTYVDQDVFFTFRSHPFYGLEIGSCTNYGFREYPPLRELWTTKPLGELVPWNQSRSAKDVLSKFSDLSYPVWLRTLHAIGDSWTAWGSTRKKIEIDKHISLPNTYGRVGFIGDYGPTTTGGFIAGMKNTWFQLRYPDA